MGWVINLPCSPSPTRATRCRIHTKREAPGFIRRGPQTYQTAYWEGRAMSIPETTPVRATAGGLS